MEHDKKQVNKKYECVVLPRSWLVVVVISVYWVVVFIKFEKLLVLMKMGMSSFSNLH